MKTIYFVRHGEGEHNVAGMIGGQTYDAPLTENGRKQAKKAGQDLKDKRIELIVSSPLSRTIETAEIIAKEIGYDTKKIQKNLLFIERSLGIYEGKAGSLYGEDLAKGTVHKSVETHEALYARFKKGFEWISGLEEEIILLVSHGGASRAVRAIAQNLPHSHMHKLEEFGNAEIYEFEL